MNNKTYEGCSLPCLLCFAKWQNNLRDIQIRLEESYGKVPADEYHALLIECQQVEKQRPKPLPTRQRLSAEVDDESDWLYLSYEQEPCPVCGESTVVTARPELPIPKPVTPATIAAPVEMCEVCHIREAESQGRCFLCQPHSLFSP